MPPHTNVLRVYLELIKVVENGGVVLIVSAEDAQTSKQPLKEGTEIAKGTLAMVGGAGLEGGTYLPPCCEFQSPHYVEGS